MWSQQIYGRRGRLRGRDDNDKAEECDSAAKLMDQLIKGSALMRLPTCDGSGERRPCDPRPRCARPAILGPALPPAAIREGTMDASGLLRGYVVENPYTGRIR
jgi:hypothetical protein